MQLKPNSLLQGGKYRIIRTLGQGGFGITYEAEQVLLRRKVALKEFFMKDCCERDEMTSHVTVGTGSQRELVEKFRVKFIREAQMIAGMENLHIIRVTDVFEENGTAYYVMDYLPEGSLANLVKRDGPLSEEKAEAYIRQIADALDYIHKQNTVHLDVKPSNILLNGKGEAVLIDFGISKHYDDSGEQTSSTPVGISKGYAPLEQGRDGDVSQFKPTTDIYALGATLYYLVTGLVPPEASIVYEEGLSRPNGISNRIWSAIETAMQPLRKNRPQTTEGFLSLLNKDVVINEDESTVVNYPNDSCIEKESMPETDQKSIPTSVSPSRHAQKLIANHEDRVSVDGNNANRGKKRKYLPWALIAGLVVFLSIAFIVLRKPFGRIDDGNNTVLTQIDSLLINGSSRCSTSLSSVNGRCTLEYYKNFQDAIVFSKSPDGEWCNITILNDSLSVSCEENKSYDSRTLDVIFSRDSDTTVLASLTVVQSGAEKPSIPQWIEESVSGIERGHEYVDLGLSVLWATCNVGAKTLSDYGGYYAYGETKTKPLKEYDHAHYKFIDPEHIDYPQQYVKYEKGSTTEPRLLPEDDAAHVLWGGKWRIPTQREQDELKKCKWTWTSINGHNGFKITGPNGKSIFLPAAGIADSLHSTVNDRGWRGFYHASDAHSVRFGDYANDTYFDIICLFFEYGNPGNPGDGSFHGLSHCLPFKEDGRSIRPVMNK